MGAVMLNPPRIDLARPVRAYETTTASRMVCFLPETFLVNLVARAASPVDCLAPHWTLSAPRNSRWVPRACMPAAIATSSHQRDRGSDPMAEPFDLQRFVDAQDGVYRRVVAELSTGRKQSHWMWFIFPQIAGLGFSAMAQRYAISSREEAAAYLAHDILGPRLVECTRLVLGVEGKTIRTILGSPDDLKFRSSMTLFSAVSGNPIFDQAIAKYYAGANDQATLDLLG